MTPYHHPSQMHLSLDIFVGGKMGHSKNLVHMFIGQHIPFYSFGDVSAVAPMIQQVLGSISVVVFIAVTAVINMKNYARGAQGMLVFMVL